MSTGKYRSRKSAALAQTYTVTDTATSTTTDILTLTHYTSGTAATDFGVGILFRGEDASGTAGGDDIARIFAAWQATPTAGSEYGNIHFQTRYSGGATMADVFKINSHNALVATVAPTGIILAVGSYIMPNGSYVGIAATQGMSQLSGNINMAVNARGSLYLNCDSDNNATGAAVIIGHNLDTASATALCTFNDDGTIVVAAGGFFQPSVSAAVTASTTQTQGNGALTSQINNISVCANVNDTVTLPAAVAGRQCIIFNNGAQTAQIFPASGDNLGAGVDTAATLTAGSNRRYVAYDATNWEIV